MRKKFFAQVVLSLGFISLAAVLGVFVFSMGPSEAVRSAYWEGEIDLSQLEVGKPHSAVVGGWPLIALRPSQDQLNAIESLSPVVADPSIDSYRSDLGIYLYWGIAEKNGISWEVLEAPNKHPNLPNSNWQGGYFSPGSDICFDYAGRAINEYSFSYNGGFGEYDNLRSPEHIEVNNQVLRIRRGLR